MSAINASDEVLLIADPTSPALADAFKTKSVSLRLGKKPIGVVLNFVRHEKGEVEDVDVIRLLEVPIYGKVPEDLEVRRSFMQKKVQPNILRAPNCKASIAMREIAYKLAGIKEEIQAAKEEKKGIFAAIINAIKNLFKKKQ